ncbi:hypothetical protein [Pseudoalteromonas luteoviolacea]|uniref:Uncharacterized protein n=1 Tax=Pseudoalteromonas luteoviolacea NCIMB 1942 TaxID=1365253 RepID=A0A167C8Q8_9GAMM|nr:hypothetical protein [Pseudoalteromonas luteoviolacea]KZN47376.1 hypothetical protein N482_09880 [Pseudoalteromonas luteoviolacea NCIMB 1942]
MKIKLKNCNFPKLSITSTEDKALEAMCIAGGIRARLTLWFDDGDLSNATQYR